MNQTKVLRNILATQRVADAVRCVRASRIKQAEILLSEAIRLDSALPQTYAILAKIYFWKGDLQSADRFIAQAQANGLDANRVAAMNSAVSAFRKKLADRDQFWMDMQTNVKAAGKQIVNSYKLIAGSITEERLNLFLFFSVVFTLISLATYMTVK